MGGWCCAGSVVIGMAIRAPGKANCNNHYNFQWSWLVPHCGPECFTQPASVAFIMLMQHNCINHHHHQLAIHIFDLKLNLVNFLILSTTCLWDYSTNHLIYKVKVNVLAIN